MKLKIKNLSFVTGGPFVSVMNHHDADDRDIKPGDRILIRKNGKKIISVVDISDDGRIKKGEIGLFDEVLNYLNTEKGDVDVTLAKRLKSLGFIRKKLEGERLSKKELFEIVRDINANNLNEVELTYFVSACYSQGLNMREIEDLTDAIVRSGSRLNLRRDIIVDKHFSGGISGNRTTMIVVPIIASLGIIIPKTSSRAISSPAGTSDTMEALASVSFDVKEIKRIVQKTNGCMVWGGAVDLASADDKMIKVRHPLSLDPEGLLLASIMAKKKAVGATHILIDIPYGRGSKFNTKKQAFSLKKKFLEISNVLGIEMKVVLTDGRQPVGNGIGPNLEAKDVLKVLMGDGPDDLRDKAIFMSTEILKMLHIKNARKIVIDCLNSGVAYNKMKEIIKAQRGDIFLPEQLEVGRFKKNIYSTRKGRVKELNNKNVSKVARVAGAPLDKTAGLYLYKKLNDTVKSGDLLFTVYSSSSKRLDYSLDIIKERNPYVIG